MMKKAKGYALNALKALFAVALVYWLIKTDRFKVEELKPFLDPMNLLTGFSIVGANILVASERWRNLLRSQGLKLTLWASWKLSQIGIFFNFAVPGGVGGDVMKAYYLQKDFNINRSTAFSSVLMDRVLGLYTCVIMALIALIYENLYVTDEQSPLVRQLLIWVALIFVVMTMALIALAAMKWPAAFQNAEGFIGKIHRFADSCKHYANKPFAVLATMLWTLLAQFIIIVFFRWAVVDIMNEPVSWSLVFFAIPVGFMIMSIPITPSGVGVGQAAFYFLFHTFSHGTITTGSLAVTAFQMLQFSWGLVGAFYYLTRKSRTPISQVELNGIE